MSITDLVYKISADSGPFAKELQKAERDVARFQKSASSGFAKLGKAFAAVGIAAATGLAAMVKNSIDAADELGKTSIRLGIATEDLSAIGFAAEQSGTSLEAFETGARALSRSIAQASTGVGKSADTFGRLGVATLDAQGKVRGTIDVVRDLADRFADIEDGAEKSALAQELFGKSGSDLIPLLNNGSAGLAEFADQAQKLGLIVSQETAASAAQLNDNIAVLNASISGLSNTVAADALPTLTAYSQRLAGVAENNGKATKSAQFLTAGLKIVLSVVEVVGSAFALVGELIGGFGALIVSTITAGIDVLKAFGRNVRAVAQAFRQAITGDFQGAFETITSSLSDSVGVVATQFGEQVDIIKDIGSQLAGVVTDSVDAIGGIWSDKAPAVAAEVASAGEKIVEEFVETSDKIVEEAEKLADKAIRPVTRAVDNQKAAFDAANRAAEEYARRLEGNLGRALDLIKTNAERFAEAVLDLDELLSVGAINGGEYRAAVAVLADQYDEATIAARRLAEEGARLTESVRTPLQEYYDSLAQLNALLDAGAISQETFAIAAESAIGRLDDQIKTTGESVQQLGVTVKDGASLIFDGFADALFNPFDASIEKLVSNFAQALGQMALAAAKQQALQAIFGAGAGAATGGLGFASGGYVSGPGTGTSDSINARLSNGEFVMRAAAVAKYGVGFMAAINQMRTPAASSTPRFADGGLVGGGGDMKVTNVNFFDQRELAEYLQSRAGEKIIINVMQRNKRALA